jgi:Domain of unknown function (DUF1707)
MKLPASRIGRERSQELIVEYARAMPEPALRASDDDRDTVLRVLERHVAEGRLNLDEFDQRSTAALAAVTRDELALLTADLPELSEEPTPVEPANHSRHLVLLFVIAFVTLAALVAMMLLHP